VEDRRSRTRNALTNGTPAGIGAQSRALRHSLRTWRAEPCLSASRRRGCAAPSRVPTPNEGRARGTLLGNQHNPLDNPYSVARQTDLAWCAANFASLIWCGAARKAWGLTLFGWIWRDARVLSRRRSFDQLNGRCARSLERVQATVVLLFDESLDLLLAPTLLALAPLAKVVIPASSPAERSLAGCRKTPQAARGPTPTQSTSRPSPALAG
jgi:hypothetical protein